MLFVVIQQCYCIHLQAGQICTFYLKNRCVYGDQCLNLHIRQAPTNISLSKSSSEIPCKFFAQGYCRWGQKCRFSHESHDTLSRSSLIHSRPFLNAPLLSDCYRLPPPVQKLPTSQTKFVARANVRQSQPDLRLTINRKAPSQPLSTDTPTFSFRALERSLAETPQNIRSKLSVNTVSIARQLGFEDSEVYTPLDKNLTQKDLEIFRASEPFAPGSVPLSAPPKELCFRC
ncbi:hypothetical protein PHET_10463 [Paragonimus heterotremus]|uniref:Nucleoporin NUP42 n=1 Tax=Paragonimus heterotremus TaxID=100268 RepID=A0A8J4WLE3_9TREM|nr:hypothetical protein PHET_10463 [Paragonimus heterotremus]